MADIPFKLVTLVQKLEDECYLAEPLLFPGLSKFGNAAKTLRRAVENAVKKELGEKPLDDIHRHSLPGPIKLETFELEVEPPRNVQWWRKPITIKFHVVHYSHGDHYVRAYVPALGIEVVATNREELDEQLPIEIKFALSRRKALTSLYELTHLDRVAKIKSESREITVPIKNAKQRALADESEEAKDSILNEVADLLITLPLPEAFEVEEQVQRLAEALAPGKGQSVLLVGPSGVGKTAVFNQLVSDRHKYGLGANDFWSTCGSRLVAGQSGFGMWEARCRNVIDELAKRKAILHLGNLVELTEVGRSTTSNLGVASFLRPFMERGVFVAVAECTEEELAIIERDYPQITGAFFQLTLEQPTREQGRLILLQTALAAQKSKPKPKKKKASEKAEEAIEADDAEDTDDASEADDSSSDADDAALGEEADDDGIWRKKKSQKNAAPKEVDYLELVGGKDGPISLEAIETIDRLHDRFATYSAYPGRPITFLKNLLRSREQHFIEAETMLSASSFEQINESEVTTAFSRQTGLPQFMLDDRVELKLTETHDWFSKRVIGQEEAVDLVVDMLARTKADLGRPRQPLASFLFIGPTGVGKTEMAKTLALYLFGSRDRMGRFDMSEFASPMDVKRLIGGVFGAEGLLTAKVREQPFSVILFDEIEKADPLFFDMLLQILGEGRLTDAGGRLASFTSTVVIMTSNLGAARIRRKVPGFGHESGGPIERHFVEEVRSFFRPELFNRIECVVPFAPLEKETIRQITHREIAQLQKLDGFLHGPLQLSIDDEAKNYLADNGYDDVYGARPLKRYIEKQLLVPLAEEVNGDNSGQMMDAKVTVFNDKQLSITVEPLINEFGRSQRFALGELSLNTVVKSCAQLRRQVHKAEDSDTIRRISNEVYRLKKVKERLRRKNLKGRRLSPKDGRAQKELAVLPALKKLQDRFFGIKGGVDSLEESSLLALYNRIEDDKVENKLRKDLKIKSSQWMDLKMDLYCRQFVHPHLVTMALYSTSPPHMVKLAKAYLDIALGQGAKIKVSWLEHYVDKKKKDVVEIKEVEKETQNPQKLLGALPKEYVGILLEMRAKNIAASYQQEGGLHEFRGEKLGKEVLVLCKDMPLDKYAPTAAVVHKNFIKSGKRRRVYRRTARLLDDLVLQDKFRWTEDKMAEALEEAIVNLMWKNINSALGLGQ